MDKILSARIDESVIRRIGSLARLMNTTKRKIIEDAITLYASRIEKEKKQDVFDQTFGSWKRKEPAQETIRKVRKAFQKNMVRHQK